MGGTLKDDKGITENVPTPDQRESLRSVYILTIPAFTWVKAPNPDPTWRSEHTCENLNERQMLVIGGVQEDLPQSTEPRPNGLGIYDLVNLNWTDTYDPNAPPYLSATIVKDVYTKSSGQPTTWGDPALPGIFKVKAIQSPSSTTSTVPTAAASSTATSTSTTTPRPAQQTSLLTIALTCTLSAVFLIALILILAIYLCKRSIAFRKAEAEMALARSKPSSSTSTFENGSLPAEVHADRIWTEMLTTANYHEVEDSGFVPVWEIDGEEKGWGNREWIKTMSRVDSASVYSVDSKEGRVLGFGTVTPSVVNPGVRSPSMASPTMRSFSVASPSVRSVKSLRAPSVRSNVEDSLEWRREIYSGQPQERMPMPIPVPPRPVLSIITNGDWI
jgi:hypothetical protein